MGRPLLVYKVLAINKREARKRLVECTTTRSGGRGRRRGVIRLPLKGRKLISSNKTEG